MVVIQDFLFLNYFLPEKIIMGVGDRCLDDLLHQMAGR